jgi:hypothetical protein
MSIIGKGLKILREEGGEAFIKKASSYVLRSLLRCILSLLGRVVVAERYAPNPLVWVSLMAGDEGYLRKPESRLALCL